MLQIHFSDFSGACDKKGNAGKGAGSRKEVQLRRYFLPGKHIIIWVDTARTFGIKYANNLVLFQACPSFGIFMYFF